MPGDLQPPLLVLLPGMDGTGLLFRAFLPHVADHETLVLRYPVDRLLDYDALERFILTQIPEGRDCLLLGESFSGPLALRLAAHPAVKAVGVVLCASFARYPLWWMAPVRGWLDHLPIFAIKRTLLFRQFMHFCLDPALYESVDDAVSQVTQAVMLGRVRCVLTEDATRALRGLAVPLLYLRARHDVVVTRAALDYILGHRPETRVAEFTTNHFLLQSMPREAAEAIRAFSASLR